MRTTITRMLAVGAALGLLAMAPQTAAMAGPDDRPEVTTNAAKAEAGPANYSCGSGVSDKDGSSWWASADEAANQRSGSSTGCGINGVLQYWDVADYHCFTVGNDGYTWTYLRNDRTDVAGWVRDDLLLDGGSSVYCGR